MSPRDVTVLVIGATTVALAGTLAALLLRTSSLSRWVSQVAGGLVCGAIAAVVSSVPYVDVVPDAEEGLAWPAVAAALVLLVLSIAVLRMSRTRPARRQPPRTRRQPARSSRSPEEVGVVARRTHSGP